MSCLYVPLAKSLMHMTKLEKVQKFQSHHLIAWILHDFPEPFFNGPKPSWCSTVLMEEGSSHVTMNANEDQLNTGLSKRCKVHAIDSQISLTEWFFMPLNKTTHEWLHYISVSSPPGQSLVNKICYEVQTFIDDWFPDGRICNLTNWKTESAYKCQLGPLSVDGKFRNKSFMTVINS